MNIIKILFLVAMMSFGAFMIVYGGYDDSPGGQLLGLLLLVGGAFAIIKGGKKSSH
jgi:hypothetical protein